MTHLRTDLYNRLPAIWRALDKELVLKRFLGVVDHDFNSIEQLITEFLEVHSVDRIPTIHLKVLGNLVGYRWRSDRTPLSAAAIIFFGVRWSYLRGTGPCATPP